jgi:hypothetical protein
MRRPIRWYNAMAGALSENKCGNDVSWVPRSRRVCAQERGGLAQFCLEFTLIDAICLHQGFDDRIRQHVLQARFATVRAHAVLLHDGGPRSLRGDPDRFHIVVLCQHFRDDRGGLFDQEPPATAAA